MSELIQTKQDLIEYLTLKPIAGKEPPKSVYVSTKLRKLVMTDETQGTFIHKGTVKSFEFICIGGGVYTASIKDKHKD